MEITVFYEAIDGFTKTRTFTDMEEAREYAAHFVGKYPTLGSHYAVSDDGVGKITCQGCSIRKLFPDCE